MSATSTTPVCSPTQLDVRGPRFGGAVTTLVLAVALVTIGSPIGLVLVAWQMAVFGIGAFVGPHAQPYGVLYRKVVQPRIGEPKEFEDAAPPRFAQAVGLVFAAIALISLLFGATLVATIAVAFALIAAFLNAAFGLCLGCEMYLLFKRFSHR